MLDDFMKVVRDTLVGALGEAVDQAVDFAEIFQLDAEKLGLKKIDFADFYDPDVMAWKGVSYADNYYQTVAKEKAAPGTTVTPNGRSLTGTQAAYRDAGFDFEIDLTGLKGFTEDDFLPLIGSKAQTHSRPHAWYAGTLSSTLSYFSPSMTKGDDKLPDRDWIVRRRADGAFEKVAGIGHRPAPYGNNQSAWYIQRLSELLGRHVDGEQINELADEAAAEDEPSNTWEGVGAGFYFSKLGGGASDRLVLGEAQRVEASVDNTEFGKSILAVPTVFNGDFQASVRPYFGRFITSYQLPGWGLHNGQSLTGSDAIQARQLEFLGFKSDWESLLESKDVEDFKATFEKYQSVFGNQFGMRHLEEAVWISNVADYLRDKLIEVVVKLAIKRFPPAGIVLSIPGLTELLEVKLQQGFDFVISKFLLGYKQEIGDFGQNLQKVADWGFRLDQGVPTLTHNRTVVPQSVQQVSFSLSSGAVQPGSDSDPVLLVKLLVDDPATGQSIEHILPQQIRIRDLPAESPTTLKIIGIPAGILTSAAESVRLQFELVNYRRGTSEKIPLATGDRVVIDNIRFGSTLSLRDSSGGEEDQMIFMRDNPASSPSTAAEGLEWVPASLFFRANEHRVDLKNDSDGDVRFSAYALPNEFLGFGLGGTASPADTTSGERLLLSNQALAKGATAAMTVTAQLTEAARKRFAETYDAVLLSGTVRFDAEQQTASGYVAAGSTSVQTVYFSELGDMNAVDGVLNAPAAQGRRAMDGPASGCQHDADPAHHPAGPRRDPRQCGVQARRSGLRSRRCSVRGHGDPATQRRSRRAAEPDRAGDGDRACGRGDQRRLQWQSTGDLQPAFGGRRQAGAARRPERRRPRADRRGPQVRPGWRRWQRLVRPVQDTRLHGRPLRQRRQPGRQDRSPHHGREFRFRVVGQWRRGRSGWRGPAQPSDESAANQGRRQCARRRWQPRQAVRAQSPAQPGPGRLGVRRHGAGVHTGGASSGCCMGRHHRRPQHAHGHSWPLFRLVDRP
jgi:hypothetical protein